MDLAWIDLKTASDMIRCGSSMWDVGDECRMWDLNVGVECGRWNFIIHLFDYDECMILIDIETLQTFAIKFYSKSKYTQGEQMPLYGQ